MTCLLETRGGAGGPIHDRGETSERGRSSLFRGEGGEVRNRCSLIAQAVPERRSGIVKGFRTPASHWRAGVYGGRRPKSLEGGNRGGVCAGGGVGLWGFSAGVCFDVSSSSREGRLSK